MLFSHHFGSLETLNRARYWLTWHGFAVQESQRPADNREPSHRLALNVSFSEAAAVRALIHSIEHAESNGRPAQPVSSSTKRYWVESPSTPSPLGLTTSSETPIHWHSKDESATNEMASKVAEYMFSRWE